MIDDIRVKFTDTGIEVPTTEDILEEIQQQWLAIFPNLNLNPSTPQGQLMTMLASIVASQNNTIMYLANQLNPQLSQGQWQDAIGQIYFLQRNPATPTQVDVICRGLQGTTIPAGSQIQDANGNIFVSKEDKAIGGGGVATITFYCTEIGKVECAVHAIDTVNGKGTIRSIIHGWDTAVNEVNGITGRDIEGQKEFEERRFRTVAKNSMGMDYSILGKVLDVDGVLDANILDNRKDYSDTIQGVELLPHSILVCALGGEDKDIAKAIYNSIPCGCNMNGDITVNVIDEVTGASNPITFARPENVRLYVHIKLNELDDTPSQYQALAKEAILDAMEDFHIGDVLYANEFYPAVTGVGIYGLHEIKVSTDGITWDTLLRPNGNQLYTLVADDITFEVERLR